MQLNLLNFASNTQVDKVLKVVTGSKTLAGGALFQTNTHDTLLGDNAFFYGIFSLDGGTVWADFGASKVTSFPATFPATLADVVDVQTSISATGTLTVELSNYYATSKTVSYKIALIAKGSQGIVLPTATDEILQFSSAFNYQKIALDDERDVTVPGFSTLDLIIPHPLTYVPRSTRSFMKRSGLLYDTGRFYAGDQTFVMSVNESDYRYHFDNTGSSGDLLLRLFTRIYHDA